MNIVKVIDKNQEKTFIDFPSTLYRDSKYFIRPLDKDIKNVFDPDQNKTFNYGECERWLLKKNGKIIGRIAAFINEKTATKNNEQPTGGIGFFDCIDDQQAANLLFDNAKEWLKQRKMDAMDGPINFGDRNAWWGLLIEGFDLEPNYQCNYNFPYYQNLFENYGFKVYFRQYTFGRPVYDPLDETVYQKGSKVLKDPNYSFKYIELKKAREYAEDFRSVYNKAWAGHAGVNEMTHLQAQNIMKQLKPIMDQKVIWFGYFKNDPIAFFISLPEVNQIFKKVKGKLDLIGKLKFLWHHKIIKSNKKLMGLVFGVVPEHQKKGVDAAIILTYYEMLKQHKLYDYIEMNWIGDFNPKMISVAKNIGGEIVKTHHTYRYLFDREKEFTRMPIKG